MATVKHMVETLSNLTVAQLVIIVFLVSVLSHIVAIMALAWFEGITRESRRQAALINMERFDDVLGRIADKAERMKTITDHEPTKL